MKTNDNELSPEQRAYLRKVISDPVLFAIHFLGVELWEREVQILHTIKQYRWTAVKACHGVGKTFSLALAALWWLARYREGIVLTTSPTERQVRTVLWSEIHRIVERARVPYPKLKTTELKLRDDHNFALGFSTNQAENFQGYHGKEVLIIADEAPGIESRIFDAIAGIMAGGKVHIVMAGNPTLPSGAFFDAFTNERGLWNCITIDAFDTPNLRCVCDQKHEDFTIEALRALPPGLGERDHPVFAHKPWPELTTCYWVYEMFWKYGEESAFFESRVRGQFPQQVQDALYPVTRLMAARAKPREQLDDGVSPVIVGIDVAGPGKDETAVTVRCGPNIIAHQAWRERDAAKQQGAVVNFLERWRGRIQCINVDTTGMGHYFPTALSGNVIQPINFGEAPRNRGKSWAVQCANRKAEMYWRTRELLEAGEIRGLDDEMISQAAQVRFFYDVRGQVAIEPKEAAARRGVSSPDRWESVVLAFGVDAYESLSKSLAFVRRTPLPANGQAPPTDPRYEELERERRMDTGMHYTNPGRFSHIKGGW
jgi:phage terminase large subunit